MAKIGIIGGSGLDDPNLFTKEKEIAISTPFGTPSSPVAMGRISGMEVALIARHGREHTIPPTQVNYRANISALKQLGCTHILATTAVGSLREDIRRGEFVVADQCIDFTKRRAASFYESFAPHAPMHTPLGDPFSETLRQTLIESCAALHIPHHPAGTIATIEGPRFSTRAESRMFRAWGADVVNMSIATEAGLANEAGIPYAAVAMVTDYDCWKTDEPPVTWEEILRIFSANAEKMLDLLAHTVETIAQKTTHEAQEKIKSKIRTVPDWPKPGIMFRDITTLLRDPESIALLMDTLANRYHGKKIDAVAGIESRGFIIGAVLAAKLGVGFIPLRKAGKLPAETFSEAYTLEYGSARLEMHTDALAGYEHILLVDDLLATGGTALAACALVKQGGGKIVECCFVINLPQLEGKQRLEQSGQQVFSVIEFP